MSVRWHGLNPGEGVMHRCEQIIKRTPVKGLDVAMLHLTCVHGWDWHQTLAVLVERSEPPASPERRCVRCEGVAEDGHTCPPSRACSWCHVEMPPLPGESVCSYAARKMHRECATAKEKARTIERKEARHAEQAQRGARTWCHWTPEQVARLVAGWNDGRSKEDLAAELGVKPAAVKDKLIALRRTGMDVARRYRQALA